MMWKNYGNSHTIFDASNSTSPDGGAVNNTDAAVPWTGTYPTLMGWNGGQTFGVRVDSARTSDRAGVSDRCSGTSDFASLMNPLSGDSNYKLGYTADGARTNAGEWGRVVMRYAPNGQTYGVRVDRADYADSAGSAGSATNATNSTNATYGRYAYNNGAYSGSGWVEPSDLGVRYAASAGAVAWGNVSGRPTSLNSFTNDPGYLTSATVPQGATGPKMQIFNDDGTFTVPAGVTNIIVVVFGAGSAGTNWYYNSATGGAGGVAAALLDVSGGQQYAVTVGRGGRSAGEAGGDSSFGGVVNAAGGTIFTQSPAPYYLSRNGGGSVTSGIKLATSAQSPANQTGSTGSGSAMGINGGSGGGTGHDQWGDAPSGGGGGGFHGGGGSGGNYYGAGGRGGQANGPGINGTDGGTGGGGPYSFALGGTGGGKSGTPPGAQGAGGGGGVVVMW
jgi:hypothetical protein